jgi:hypothetical protein
VTLDIKFVQCLLENEYTDLKRLDGNYVGALMRFLFTTAIIKIRINEYNFYEDRWCYKTVEDARTALAKWDGKGEPDGWHRHPTSGRRRENDNEYVML